MTSDSTPSETLTNPTPNDPQVDSWIVSRDSGSGTVDLSIVIPAYNELRRLPLTLMEMIDYLDSKKVIYELIVVDDGSRDGTHTVVNKFEKIRSQVRLIRVPKNCGKGFAVRVGVLSARGDRILFADADGSTPIAELERLSNAIDSGADIAIGSRAKQSTETRVKTRWYRKYLGRTFNLVVNLYILPGIQDTQCGFKLFRSSCAKELFELQTSTGFSFDVELLFLAKRLHKRVTEVPINWTNVPGSKVNLFVDSIRMLKDIFLFRFRHRGIGQGIAKSQN